MNGDLGVLLRSLHSWCLSTLKQVSKKSDIASAIHYALARSDALTGYTHDGRIEIDNNAAELALRAVASGRKNYLFAGTDRGGQREAAICSLIGTCKLNDINPEAYLRHVLAHAHCRTPDQPHCGTVAKEAGGQTQQRYRTRCFIT
jgi:hypothetical protein